MSSETAPNPEVEATQDQGRTLSSDERLTAANRDVADSFEASGDVIEGSGDTLQAEESEDIVLVDDPSIEEVTPGDANPEIEAEDPAAVQATESVKTGDADGDSTDPATPEVPDALRAEYDNKMARIEKGLQKRLSQLADKEKQLDTLILQNRHMMDNKQQAQADATKPQRPQAPGEGATATDWQNYEDAVIDYRLDHSGNKSSGMSDKDNQRLAVLEQKQAIDSRLGVITSQPGATDEIMQKMQDMAAGDEGYMKMYFESENTAIQFFNMAKMAIREEVIAKREAELNTQSAESAKAKATRQAGAAGRATARPGNTKAASTPAENFDLKSFNNVDDALAHINEGVLKEAGAK